MRPGFRKAAFVGAVAACVSGSAAAAGFQLLEQNASGIGNAYAGSAAVAENAATIFFNPAGMTRLKDREYSVGLTAVEPSFKFENGGSTVPNAGAASLSGSGGDGGSLSYVPNAYLSWALNKDVYLGLGVSGPFGLMTEYGNTWLGAAQSIKFDIKTYNLNPSVAWRVNDRVSLGFGLNLMRMDVEYLKRYAALPRAPATARNPIAKLTADDDAWGWNAGVLFDLTPATRIGISYRSKVKQQLDGKLAIAGVTSFGAKADLDLPDTAILSIVHQLNPDWELLGDISWTGWSSVPKVDIVSKATGTVVQRLNTAFDDSMRVAVGANYRLNPAWKLKFGVAYDSSPVPDADHRLVSLPDNDRLWLSVGAQWQAGKDATLDLGAAYLYVRNTDINAVSAATGTTVKGSYDSYVKLIGLQFSQAF